MFSLGVQKSLLLKRIGFTPSVFVRYRNTIADKIDGSKVAGTGGNAEIYASTSVDAKASTAGNIEILGDPEQVTKKESTGGNIDN